MTVSRLRKELTDAELVQFAAFYEVKGEREEKAMQRAKQIFLYFFFIARSPWHSHPSI